MVGGRGESLQEKKTEDEAEVDGTRCRRRVAGDENASTMTTSRLQGDPGTQAAARAARQ